MRKATLAILVVATSGDGSAFGQVESEAREHPDGSALQQERPEEVIVRGRRLTDLRVEVQIAREHAYAIFNDINSDDDFDVYCREEARTGTRRTVRVCRAQFEGRISSDAAQEYMSALTLRCPPEWSSQECIFSEYSSGAISAAQGVESEALSKRDQMTEEIFRLARQDERFAQAILDWYEANRQYETARKRGSD